MSRMEPPKSWNWRGDVFQSNAENELDLSQTARGFTIVICRMRNAGFNVGEEVILSSILRDLSRLAGVAIEVLSDGPKLLSENPRINYTHAGLRNILGVFRSIRSGQVLLWGGGNMLQDQSSALDIPYHLTDLFVAQLSRTPVILYAVEIGPVNTRIGAFFSRMVLNRVDLIIVRNNKSESVLKRIGVKNPRIYVTADPAFMISPGQPMINKINDQYKLRDGRPIVGIAPRKAFYKVGGLLPATIRLKLNLMPRNFRQKFASFKKKMAQTCDYLVGRLQAQILFLPMDVARNPRDDLVCRDIMDLMLRKEDAFLLEPHLGPSEVVALIGAMDLVISQRLHALILACSMNIPMIGIASTGEQDKCKVFMEEIGQGHRCVDAESIIDGTESLFDIISDTWKNRKEVKKKLELEARHLRMRASMNVGLVSRSLSNLQVINDTEPRDKDPR